MVDQYIKQGGTWTVARRPYVKRNNIWTPVVETWVKETGVWTKEWTFDNIPPPVPELSLEIIDNRYIRCSVRLPDTQNNPDLRMIRVMALVDAQPGSQYGTGLIGGNDAAYPHENWSDWYYNNAYIDDHGDSSVNSHKDYPVNPTSATNLPGAHYYYFSAWAQDFDGNWSVGCFSRIYMPQQGVAADNVIYKETNVQMNTAGSLSSTNVFTSGDVKAHQTPTSDGIFFCGSKFTDSIGQNGVPTVTSARILVSRRADAGQPQATVRMGWHEQTGSGDYDSSLSNDRTVLGTIQKGEAKWFSIPTTWYRYFNTRIAGFVLKRGPDATDDIELNGLGTDLRCGEVNITWEETV